MKIRLSEKPERSDKQRTMGSLTSISNFESQSSVERTSGKGCGGRAYRSQPDSPYFLRREPIILDLVRAPDVRFASFPATLCFSVEEDGLAGFGNHEEVHELDEASTEKLDPKLTYQMHRQVRHLDPLKQQKRWSYVPPPMEVGGDDWSNERPEDRSTDRRENDVRQRVLMVVRIPDIGDWATISRVLSTIEKATIRCAHLCQA